MSELAHDFLGSVLGTHNAEAELQREGVEDTPARFHKAMHELLSGYSEDPYWHIKTFPATSNDLVIVKQVPYVSMCEHHVLPFRGEVSVGYIPDEQIIGLSKIPRIIRALSRRMQVQESLTAQIAEVIDTALKPRGVIVVVRGVHSCAELRGIEARAEMITSHVRGVFRDNATARAEVLGLLK